MKTDTVPVANGKPSVLLVDDEPDMLNMLSLIVRRQCHCDVILAATGAMAIKEMESHVPDVVVTDIKMPDMDGLTLLKKIRERDETISVIVMTGYGTIEMAVQALKDGAYDFLEKPFDKDHIVRVIHNCLERTRLLRDNRRLQERLAVVSPPEGFVGHSPALRQAMALITRVADTDATVLIRGESGTGKEGAARALHALSKRCTQKMIVVNCPALPEHILESELFGYRKGAFTGAMQDKKGLFLAANHSTILLDEIGDIPVSIQTKLLRVLQEKEIQPLGQNDTIKIDVRVVASTNQNLEAKMASGEFREDLFYRLNVVTVTMPSLKEMKEDIPLLVQHFLRRYQKQYKRQNLVITPKAMQMLFHRHWQGNVRELKNTVKRAVLLAPQNEIDVNEISATADRAEKESPLADFSTVNNLTYKDAKAEVVEQFSIFYITNLLIRHQGNVTASAKDSGLDRQAFQRIMRRYGLTSRDFRNNP
ncbi:MAG: DNA-binding response regulator [Desulfobulbaceae bacterium DB1]|nr:MAG: DNA-binding response regulator [Desulfobulbaceae bacterium DB1]